MRRLIATVSLCLFAQAGSAPAQESGTETLPIAVLGALDKITARVSELVVPVGERTEFFRLTIDVTSCQRRIVGARQESGVFLVITEQPVEGDPERLFSGWMFAGSPSVSALDHPIYDVWLVRCAAAGQGQEGEGG